MFVISNYRLELIFIMILENRILSSQYLNSISLFYFCFVFGFYIKRYILTFGVRGANDQIFVFISLNSCTSKHIFIYINVCNFKEKV